MKVIPLLKEGDKIQFITKDSKIEEGTFLKWFAATHFHAALFHYMVKRHDN